MVKLEDIVSLCKRRGFIFQGSEVYGGMAGTWDFGPLGVTLKHKVMQSWWKYWVEDRDDMYGVDAAIIMNPKTWEASGHTSTFADPLIECSACHGRFRADKIKNPKTGKNFLANVTRDEMIEAGAVCPTCGKKEWGELRMFNMMFSTHVGAVADETSIAYLRPETAQGIFTNYKNIVDSIYPDLPFGIAQQGKAFRNEISPRDFIFRDRECEQMEIEYFIAPEGWEKQFEKMLADIHDYLENVLHLPAEMIHDEEVEKADLAHYSKRTVDINFDFAGVGADELMGLAYRTNFDLSNIQKYSGKNMEYIVKGGNERFIPHVLEPSLGVERTIMALLTVAYCEDEVNGEKRIVLKLPEEFAPYRFCVSPLLKNKPELVAKAKDVYAKLRKKYGNVTWDDSGNIGKRYRKQDEIGTPKCVVVDFDTLEDDTVTVRDRDTTEQVRVKINEL